MDTLGDEKEFSKASAKLKASQSKLKTFCTDNNLSYKADRTSTPGYGKSVLYGDLDTAQSSVNTYAETGEIKLNSKKEWTNKEFITLNNNVGELYDDTLNEYIPTKRFSIHHGKKGTHVVPAKEI